MWKYLYIDFEEVIASSKTILEILYNHGGPVKRVSNGFVVDSDLVKESYAYREIDKGRYVFAWRETEERVEEP